MLSKFKKRELNQEPPQITLTESYDEESTKNDEETVASPSPYGYVVESVLVDDAKSLYCFSRKSAMLVGLFLVTVGMAITAVAASALSKSESLPMGENTSNFLLPLNSSVPTQAPSINPINM